MNRSLFALVVISLFMLSACTGMHGEGDYAGPNNDLPQGYGVSNQESEGLRPVLKPGRLMTEPKVATEQKPEPVWNKISDYDETVSFVPDASRPKKLTQKPAPSSPVKTVSGIDYNNNGSVMVYPLDGDIATLDYDTSSLSPYAPSDDLQLSIVSSKGVELVDAGGAGYNYYPSSGDLASAVYFGYGSTLLGRGDRSRLADMARGLGERGVIHVAGHASKRVDGVNDPVMRRIINLKMSMKRAEVVSAELLRAGIAPERIETLGLGDTRPNGNPGSKGQEAADRRVEIYLGRSF